MLTRAARRRQTLRYLEHVADNLQLPFLCPSLSQQCPGRSQHTSITSRHTNLKAKTVTVPSPQARRLASAAPVPEAFDRSDDFTSQSFYLPSEIPISHRQTPYTSSLPQWDLASLLRLDNTTALPPERLNTNKIIGNGIRGNSIEVERNLQACLHLRKWNRATANLHQLAVLYHGDEQRILFHYNTVLAHMVDDCVEGHDAEVEDRIAQWIERDMKHASLDPNAQTFALVIKAALTAPGRSKRERTVRRYWEMANKHNLLAEVGSLRDILSERDLGMISQICPFEHIEARDEHLDVNSEPEIILSEDVLAQKKAAHIIETEQKGLGLTALKQTLALFSDAEDQSQRMTAKDPVEREEHVMRRQHRLERDAIDSAVSRWKIEHDKMAKMGVPGNLSHGKIGALLWQWHEMLSVKISQEVERVKEAETKERRGSQERLRAEYGPFLESMKPEKLAAVTVIALMQIMNKAGTSKSIKLVRLVTELGKVVEAEQLAEKAAAQNDQKSSAMRRTSLADAITEPVLSGSDDAAAAQSQKLLYRRQSGNRFTHSGSASTILRVSDWTVAIQAKVGAILCELMFDTAKIAVEKQDPKTAKKISSIQPIFIRQTVFSNGRKVGVVSLHEDFVKILAREPAGDMIAKQLPMVCKPRAWTGFSEGGYLDSDQPVLRVKNRESLQKDYAVAAAERGDLDQLFAGLDVLGGTGWKINRAVFNVMTEAWNTGEAIANLPPLNKDVDLPPRPPTDAPTREKYDWFSKVRAIDNERSGHHSNRCFQNFQMEIAKAYLDETFYLPHNVDFRGRAYPLPPYLNQMGADNCRGLMLFSDGRALGKDGLRWLKIHLSNVFGYDKASLDDRAEFPMTHIDDIRDSVTNPLGGRRWWLTAEDPWQCLATCYELVNALDSPDPTAFVSHLPVHQDGSCNGLQHYAALGGDIAGAKQVNLEPGDKPADVYTGVAELVKAEIAHDAQQGNELAKLLDGRIARKIVKQTVMTNVYGVTFLGAIRQVRKQVDSLLPDLTEAQMSGKAATYIARKIFKALGSLFTGAHEIQYWLGDCANRISGSISPAQLQTIAAKSSLKTTSPPKPGRRVQKKSKAKDPLDPASFRTSVIWTTPLKLPVVQPYRVNKSSQIKTNLQHISLVEPSVADAVNKRKQLQAFPPNFVHSLDATHMILSALKADELGLSFSAVHDSFWTHAADVDALNVLLREAFIRMHSEDIVGRLAAEFRMRYQGHLYMAQILKGSRLAKAIVAYRTEMADKGELPRGAGAKGIKDRRYAELLREVKKRDLLASQDPEKRAEGEKMVTAASLFEQMNGEQFIFSRDSLGETAIGAVPSETNEARLQEALHSEDVASDVDLQGTLEPLMESVTEANEARAVEASQQEEAAKKTGPKNDSKTKPATNLNNAIWLWLPLTFRPVPKKGDFDVRRLRDSQYFFS